MIEWGDSFLGWDYRASDELNTIRKELHLAIPFQNHLLAMGDEIRRSEPLHGGDYIGVHLRGESDWPLQWGDAEQQKANYKAQMRRIREGGSDVSAVFVSSGDHDAIDRFRAELEPLGYAVHDKWSIMEALGEKGGLGEIEAVDFDSKGIVDYAVLVGAKYFMGVRLSLQSPLLSSFSFCHDRADPSFARRADLHEHDDPIHRVHEDYRHSQFLRRLHLCE